MNSEVDPDHRLCKETAEKSKFEASLKDLSRKVISESRSSVSRLGSANTVEMDSVVQSATGVGHA